jgi:hypothetical protein
MPPAKIVGSATLRFYQPAIVKMKRASAADSQ